MCLSTFPKPWKRVENALCDLHFDPLQTLSRVETFTTIISNYNMAPWLSGQNCIFISLFLLSLKFTRKLG